MLLRSGVERGGSSTFRYQRLPCVYCYIGYRCVRFYVYLMFTLTGTGLSPVASFRARWTPPNVPLPIGARMVTSSDGGTMRRLMEDDENGDAIEEDATDDSSTHEEC